MRAMKTFLLGSPDSTLMKVLPRPGLVDVEVN
jgi:hypothetical protein